ncbi:uncharacterized protein LOC113563441 [Ooceraea biroi]|uniref:uncharacterized protein LOC113563441 n=1 Tax=Ooceraea biroi TaxID=2015173 RepID=UPI000F078519|nr:uncharacterized protein LOC113563441 [Ooceraea biroi]
MDKESEYDRITDEMIEKKIVDRIDKLIDRKVAELLAIKSDKDQEEIRRTKVEERVPLPAPPAWCKAGAGSEVKGNEAKEKQVQPRREEEKRKDNMQERRQVERRKEERRVKIPRRVREEKTVAIAIQIPVSMEGMTYAEVLRKAKEEINIDEMGIDQIKTRTTLTGGRVMEIGGENAKEITKELSEEEAKQAVAEIGGCDKEEIVCGRIRKTANGLGTLWLRLPIRTAWNVARMKQVRIGWTMANVTLLEKR